MRPLRLLDVEQRRTVYEEIAITVMKPGARPVRWISIRDTMAN